MNTKTRVRLLSESAAMVALLIGGLLESSAPAARIPEPDTTVYGRIVESVGPHAFLVTRGELVWNLRSTGPGAKEVRLTTRLERLGEGLYSYRLRIPHDAMAYDLAVRSRAVGLTAAGSKIQHVSITLDGRPLALTPAVVDGFALSQARRSGVQRIDLEAASASIDSDGDGAPDWWEDENGLDRFDPADAAARLASAGGAETGGTGSGSAGSSEVRTFEEWRAAWFPGRTGDLDVFGGEDGDRDGVSNFLEYAFGLDPTRPDGDAAGRLPRAVREAGKGGVEFQRRAGATDLEYSVETSLNLAEWEVGDELVTKSEGSVQKVYADTRSGDGPESHRFFRVRVSRRP